MSTDREKERARGGMLRSPMLPCPVPTPGKPPVRGSHILAASLARLPSRVSLFLRLYLPHGSEKIPNLQKRNIARQPSQNDTLRPQSPPDISRWCSGLLLCLFATGYHRLNARWSRQPSQPFEIMCHRNRTRALSETSPKAKRWSYTHLSDFCAWSWTHGGRFVIYDRISPPRLVLTGLP